MQSVTNTFTVESHERTRKIGQSVQVSWKKGLDPNITLFTIGVSTIGGGDLIAGTAGVDSSWSKYQYFDESSYVQGMDYEREVNVVEGGMSKGLFDVDFDNTSNRYLPDYAGGNSELFTSILPRRPVIINAGFNYNGINNLIPQFVGINTKNPELEERSKKMRLSGSDFIDFLQNKYVDQTSMFTGLRTDQVIENILSDLGYSTAQYDLDQGINTINFGILEKGTKFGDIIDKIVRAEKGRFYQDEVGVLRFENTSHWDNAPHTEVQTVIFTADVIDRNITGVHNIVNVVEVNAKPRVKDSNQIVFKLSTAIELPVGETDVFIDFEDPMLSIDAPIYVANTSEDDTGTDITTDVPVSNTVKFARSAKFTFNNTNASAGFITRLTLYGRPAKVSKDIYIRNEDQSSLTAYEEQPLTINNDYIQTEGQANDLANLIINTFSDPESLQELTIRAFPELQIGDLISWQGKNWIIYGIGTTIDPSIGFTQTLKLMQKAKSIYFRIGISTIGGADQIAP